VRQIKKSLILFGEGKTEAAFLSHLYRSHRDQLPETKVKTDRKTEYVAKLKKACPKLFTRECIEEKRSQNPCIQQILDFLGV